MSARHHILGSNRPRPPSRRTLYCDGSADAAFRDDVDVELSHWIPNRTPEAYRADTSTEIVLNFVAAEARGEWDLVVNNHVDVDGILSVFAGIEPDLALAHRRTLVEAAEMGDFWGYGDVPAQRLFQALIFTIVDGVRRGLDTETLYTRGFDAARDLLAGRTPACADVEPGVRALADSVDLIERGVVERRALGPRFTQYVVSADVEHAALARRCVPFNAPLDVHPLSPHARARFDADRAQLVSVESRAGWHHDLYYPGYIWADTVSRWRAPGLTPGRDGNEHAYDYAPLTGAVDGLARAETKPGRWRVAEKLTPFSALGGRGFPIVASFLPLEAGEDGPAPSSLGPDAVAKVLVEAFGGLSPATTPHESRPPAGAG